MDIHRRIRESRTLTPAEQQLGQSVLALGERLQGLTIKELARAAAVSVPTVHRFCRKLGLTGFKELKVELARSSAAAEAAPVDINFPFTAGEDAERVAAHLQALYDATLRDTRELLDPAELDRAADLLARARRIDIYTQSHNLFPAQMLCERLISVGREVTCHERDERQIRRALASGEGDVAVMISYSGLNPHLRRLIPLLAERRVPVIFVGTPAAQRRNPGLAVYLNVSDHEDLQDRITQFASHIAVQFVLDALFGCMFARTYDEGLAFLEASLPYTRLPAAEG